MTGLEKAPYVELKLCVGAACGIIFYYLYSMFKKGPVDVYIDVYMCTSEKA